MEKFNMNKLIKMYVLCLIGAFAGEHFNVNATTLIVEAEDMITMGNPVHERSQASNKETVYLHQGDTIYFEFCLMANTTVTVTDVVYSNDGGSDRLEIAIDSEVLDGFDTDVCAGGGSGWNRFHHCGSLFPMKAIAEGRHRLSLFVKSSDQYGVEVDFLRMTVNSSQGIASLRCNIFCFDDITYADDMLDEGLSAVQGVAKQRSVHTNCAEEDNINIPVFHENVSKFIIFASLPKYTSFSNNRGADWTRCQMITAFWKFSNFTLTDKSHTSSKSAQMNISVSPLSLLFDQSFDVATISVDFHLEGPMEGSTDSEIGTDVYLNQIQHNGDLSITFQYYGREGVWSSPRKVTLGNLENEARFTTPDFTFSEGNNNKIRMQLFSSQTSLSDIQIGEFYMFKRNIHPDTTRSIYKDGVTVIEIVDMDMWWRINETMQVTTVHNGNTYTNADYIRIYQRVPWSDDSYSQVFVLYQDGNIRLLPVTPHGLDWIPFGSSVLIGQSDPSAKRPSAPIRTIKIDPHTLHMTIFYMDGGIISLDIKTSLKETQLVISDSSYTRDLNKYPFFTFRSMWITDGNSDVDHITTGGNSTYGIIGQWTSMRGNFFAFYRMCISKHNTLSPDIRLKIIG